MVFVGSHKAGSSLWSIPSNDSRGLQPPCCSFVSHWRFQSGLFVVPFVLLLLGHLCISISLVLLSQNIVEILLNAHHKFAP